MKICSETQELVNIDTDCYACPHREHCKPEDSPEATIITQDDVIRRDYDPVIIGVRVQERFGVEWFHEVDLNEFELMSSSLGKITVTSRK